MLSTFMPIYPPGSWFRLASPREWSGHQATCGTDTEACRKPAMPGDLPWDPPGSQFRLASPREWSSHQATCGIDTKACRTPTMPGDSPWALTRRPILVTPLLTKRIAISRCSLSGTQRVVGYQGIGAPHWAVYGSLSH